jgi:hypothetical protein
MAEMDKLLTADERVACIHLTAQEGVDGQRARALLAIDDGATQSAAAEQAGLTEGQLRYFLGKFRQERLAAFPDYLIEASPALTEEAADALSSDKQSQNREALHDLIHELDELIAALRAIIPESTAQTPYSPLRLMTLIRNNAGKMTPEAVRNVRQSFEGVTVEDLRDLDTWKGLGYVMVYSTRFQAGQVGGRIQSYIPGPLQPNRLLGIARKGVDKIIPDFARQILGVFEGASKEDLLDPDTWKGVWYMINYSLQFQAEQLKERLLAAEEAEK